MSATIFTHSLQDYAQERNLIPAERIATQNGVQGRDMISFLAQLDAAFKRMGISVYSLVRDQMKGFDLLCPLAAKDAYRFFGIGKAPILFNRIRLASSEMFIKTPMEQPSPLSLKGRQSKGTHPVRFIFRLLWQWVCTG